MSVNTFGAAVGVARYAMRRSIAPVLAAGETVAARGCCGESDERDDDRALHGPARIPPLDSPRGSERQEDPDHRRSRLHRNDARPAARRRQRGDRVRQPPPRCALGHRPRRAPELPLRAGRRARPAGADRGHEGRRRTSSTPPGSRASTPCSRAPCGRCAST